MSDPILKRYYLDIMTTGVNSTIGLNDVPLFVDVTGAGLRTIVPVNDWLMPGANALTVRVAWPEGKDYVQGKAEMKVFLFEADLNEELPELKSFVLLDTIYYNLRQENDR